MNRLRIFIIHSISVALVFAGTLQPPKTSAQTKPERISVTRETILEGAKKEGQLVVFPGFARSTTPHLVNSFKKKYPFIKEVTWAKAPGSSRARKMISEMTGGTATADVFRPVPDLWEEYFKRNLYKNYDIGTLAREGHLKIPQEMIDESGVVVWSGTIMGVMAYNSNLIPQDKVPSGWESCLDPQWKGKFSVDTKPLVFSFLVAQWGEERVLKFARKLKANNPIWLRGNSRALGKLAAGQFSFICGTYLHAMQRLMKRHSAIPIKIVMPDPLPVSFHEPEGIYSGARNPNAGLLWIEFLASKEGQDLLDSVDPGRASFLIEGTLANRFAKGANVSICAAGCRDRKTNILERIAVGTWGLRKVGEQK